MAPDHEPASMASPVGDVRGVDRRARPNGWGLARGELPAVRETLCGETAHRLRRCFVFAAGAR